MLLIQTLMLALFSMTTATQDKTMTVTVADVHICCNGCVRAIGEAAADVEDASVASDRTLGTVAITAPKIVTVQNVIDALAKAGYHGTPNSEKVAFKDDSGAPDREVETLTLTGMHNCCRACSNAISKTAESIEGVEEVEVEPQGESVTLTGSIDAKVAVKAFNDAGFHVKVKNTK